MSLSSGDLNQILCKTHVEVIMTRYPVIISQEAIIGEAARSMLKNRISCLPVVDSNGELVGIITESVIFRLVVQEWEKSQPAKRH